MLFLLNKLKNQAIPGWLTDSQLTAFTALVKLFRFPEVANLYGSVGSGKTFLAWVLSQQLEIPYFPTLSDFDRRCTRPTPQAIVDNATAGERSVRHLLAVAQRKGAHTLLFVTLRPNEMGFQSILLPEPTPKDFDIVYRNLSLLEFYALPPIREGTLWDAIHAVL